VITAIDWGPVGVWAGAIATALAVIVALVSSLGLFGRYHRARLRITFEPAQPWCRFVQQPDGSMALWARVGVENVGGSTARGCIGRLIGLSTDGVVRTDVDPLQLRWAGVPRSMSFEPVDIRPGQREFLNVLFLVDGSSRWTIDTFSSEDFQPGFDTELDVDHPHVVQIALYADNADTITHNQPLDPGAQQLFQHDTGSG
jgi:hypothetical protein